MTKYLVALLLSVFWAVTPAAAQSSSFTAHITQIFNSQGAPNSFDFTTDNTPSVCNGFTFYFAAGADEPSKIANFNAVYATVLAALLSGHSVFIGVNNPTSSINYCTVTFLNPTNQ
jgi:hypothetical protein